MFCLDQANEIWLFLANVLIVSVVSYERSMHVPNLLRTMPEKDSYEMMELEKTRTESALYDDSSRMYDDPYRITAE